MKRRIGLVLSLLALVLIFSFAYGNVNTKSFDREFDVDREKSDLLLEKISLNGQATKLLFGKYLIKGNIYIDNRVYNLRGYELLQIDPESKEPTFLLKFGDKNRGDRVINIKPGDIIIYGDMIIHGDITSSDPVDTSILVTSLNSAGRTFFQRIVADSP